jgi:Na+-transporting NADH:ubiquinone oxidoreductase subunit C
VDTKRSSYSILYAAALGLVCALALTAIDRATEERKAANAQAEEVRNVLTVLGVPFDADAAATELLETYNGNVSEEERGGVSFYSYDNPQAGRLSATRFEGPGLWGPIEGLLCLEEDMTTIYAVSFYRHEETPGLGGEISEDWFQDQFRGKSIVDAAGSPGLRIVGDGADGVSEVDAISGATMTGDKVEEMLNKLIEELVSGSGGDG